MDGGGGGLGGGGRERGRGEKTRDTGTHESPAAPSLLTCHTINVNRSDLAGNSACGRLEAKKQQGTMYMLTFQAKGKTKLTIFKSAGINIINDIFQGTPQNSVNCRCI